MIEVKNLTKKYDALTALDNVTFNIESGIIGFLGPNGAGKSTTMRILSGYMPPTEGTALIKGINVGADPVKVKEIIGYLPEDNPLYGDLTPLDYLEFCGRVRNIAEEKLKKRIAEVSEICGIKDVIIRPIGELSKGYKQRVGLAQAILHDPPILILDEPTTGLDPNQIEEIRNLIKNLQEEKTIILSTHIMQEVRAVCQRVIIINQGRIVADGTHDELTGGTGKTVYNVELEGPSENIRAALNGLPGIDSVRAGEFGFIVEAPSERDPRRKIFELAVKNDWTILRMEKTRQSLEDVFRKLTKEGEAAAVSGGNND